MVVMIPLVLAYIPALVAYVLSEHALTDAFSRRQNACAVLEEFIKLVKKEPHELQKAVDKCKGSVKCPCSFTAKTMAALHDALCKNTPELTRPVNDMGDACDLEAWNAERSFMRELFGTQIQRGKDFAHPLLLELLPSGTSLVKCVRDYLGEGRVLRAPLILACGFPARGKFVDYPYEFEFGGVKYTLAAVATHDKVMYHAEGWLVDGERLQSINSLVTKDACVVVYRRT